MDEKKSVGPIASFCAKAADLVSIYSIIQGNKEVSQMLIMNDVVFYLGIKIDITVNYLARMRDDYIIKNRLMAQYRTGQYKKVKALLESQGKKGVEVYDTNRLLKDFAFAYKDVIGEALVIINDSAADSIVRREVPPYGDFPYWTANDAILLYEYFRKIGARQKAMMEMMRANMPKQGNEKNVPATDELLNQRFYADGSKVISEEGVNHLKEDKEDIAEIDAEHKDELGSPDLPEGKPPKKGTLTVNIVVHTSKRADKEKMISEYEEALEVYDKKAKDLFAEIKKSFVVTESSKDKFISLEGEDVAYVDSLNDASLDEFWVEVGDSMLRGKRNDGFILVTDNEMIRKTVKGKIK